MYGLTCDVFCRVVDNYGDAGIAWRLARELALEHGARVRLWIDDLAALHRLKPVLDVDADEQSLEGVVVVRWSEQAAYVSPARVVVEAFGCGLPDAYVAAMAAARPKPLWIVLEYLSAEAWVAEHHALASPPPRWPLERYFFFPGFVAGTGGLLRESGLFERRDRFGRVERERLWARLGHQPPPADAITASLFAYETAPVAELVRACEEAGVPTVLAVPEGKVLPAALRELSADEAAPGALVRRGALELRFLPFVAQPVYDELLWACDVNFVRGEDSFVRAQWAARPFVWHVYPQTDRAHAAKLEAFLALYCEGLDAASREAVTALMRWWNRIDARTPAGPGVWRDFVEALPALRVHGPAWAERLAQVGSLSGNLARFCAGKLK